MSSCTHVTFVHWPADHGRSMVLNDETFLSYWAESTALRWIC